MPDKDLKNINASVSKECWKQLKIFSIQKDISLNEYIKQILERHTNKKGQQNLET